MGDDVLRCEELQQRVQCDFHRAASDEVRRALGLRLEEVDGALVSVATGEPSILFNRTIGLGVGAPASAATVAAIRDVYAGAGIGRYFVHLHPAARPAGLRAWLEEAGLRPARAWTAFERGAKPAPEAGTDLVVAPIAADKAEDFGRIVADAFDMGAAAVPLFAGLARRPGWRLYLGFADGRPAAAGALFVDGEVGWLGFGATVPALRRRGGQRAMLARRIEDARGLGCRLLLTETGEAVPGDPQHSHHNIEWSGFRPAFRLENYAPA